MEILTIIITKIVITIVKIIKIVLFRKSFKLNILDENKKIKSMPVLKKPAIQ